MEAKYTDSTPPTRAQDFRQGVGVLALPEFSQAQLCRELRRAQRDAEYPLARIFQAQ